MFINVERITENVDFLVNVATLLLSTLASVVIVITAGLSIKGIKKVKAFEHLQKWASNELMFEF